MSTLTVKSVIEMLCMEKQNVSPDARTCVLRTGETTT